MPQCCHLRARVILEQICWILSEVSHLEVTADVSSCASSCLDCYGPSPNECSSCRGQQAVLKGECVMYHESTGQCETRGEGGPMIFTGGDSSQCERG